MNSRSSNPESAHINPEEMAALLRPYGSTPLESRIAVKLCDYLDLLLRWNAHTNLTSIRSAREIVHRHFGESLFAAQNLPEGITTLLDFGSGAGFPGLPIQLFRPDLEVTLAESQNKKAGFLREAVRTLGLPAQVFAGRVEALPLERRFSAITLRAVDNIAAAIPVAIGRLAAQGWLILLTSRAQETTLNGLAIGLDSYLTLPTPNSEQRILWLARKR